MTKQEVQILAILDDERFEEIGTPEKCYMFSNVGLAKQPCRAKSFSAIYLHTKLYRPLIYYCLWICPECKKLYKHTYEPNYDILGEEELKAAVLST